MYILVIGGAGYIGSHICKALFLAGYIPVVYDDLSKGHRWALKWGHFIEGDLRDEEKLLAAFCAYPIQAVIHLAAFSNVRESIQNPLLYYENHWKGALSLVKVLLQRQIKALVFSSTAAVYGNPHYLPIDEKHPKEPLNAYGKTKWAIEGLFEDVSKAYPFSFAALRYFNACGADDEGEIGEVHDPETHLIPLVIQTALGVRKSLTIYGDDYPTFDGTAIRDYIHVCDLASAHIKALQYLLEKKRSVQLNLGTGKGYSVKEIIDEVERFGKVSIPKEIVPRLAQDSSALVADASLARHLLNWSPTHSDLQTIIATAWKWQAALYSIS